MGQRAARLPLNSTNQHLTNGGFSIAQRGASFSFPGPGASSAFTLDRWVWAQSGDGGAAGSVSIAQLPFVLGQTEVPNNPRHYCRIANASLGMGLGVTSHSVLYQRIETVTTLAGKAVTVSIYARSSVPNRTFSIELIQFFGTGGSASVLCPAKAFSLTTTFKRYSFTLTLPSAAGKVLGSGANDCVQINLWVQSGAGWGSRSGSVGEFGGEIGSIDFANIKLELGQKATPVQPLTAAQDLQQCQRYAWKANGELLGIVRDGFHVFNYGKTVFPTPMRVAPTLLNGILVPDAGLTGAPWLASPTPYSTGIYNSANNWTVGVGVLFSGLFEAEL